MEPGDRVIIETSEDSFEGVLIPRPEMLEKGILVLKLDSGYNIGIEDKKIKKSKVVEKYKAKVENKKSVKENPDLPTVAILSYGGTISSKVDYKTGGTKADYTAEDFLSMCPELRDIANIKAEKIMQIMSEDIDLKTLTKMADSLIPFLEDDRIKGIVLTMGTDTLHYIAAGLSFMLQDLPKPIIITAAQRSIDRGSSDAFMNLSCSVKAAAEWNGSEIVTCLHKTSDDIACILIRGTKVRKMHTSRRDAFRPVNDLPLARITYPQLDLDELDSAKKPGKLVAKTKLSDKVALVHVYPGIKGDVIDHYVEKGYKGIVVAGTALGHVPTEGSFLPALKKSINAGVPIIIATQTLYGRTHPFVYTNLRKLSIQLGCIFAEDMLPEVAYMKLSWILVNGKIEDFRKNLVGEINTTISVDSFLA